MIASPFIYLHHYYNFLIKNAVNCEGVSKMFCIKRVYSDEKMTTVLDYMTNLKLMNYIFYKS